jgi:asparagine synthase (glutamine-hydrolysing)
MCGIFGVAYHDIEKIPDEERLAKSVMLMAHRGPDSSGIHHEAGIGFAHTRLSLVDLDDRSRQPFHDRTGRYVLVFNGEIYNFRVLRSDMEGKGIVFRTSSDTEVLLEGLIRYGDSFLDRLEGMFAFGFFDRRDRTLLIARDRFGIKPLYVYGDSEQFLFASEIKAMRPWIRFKPNLLSISSYLLGGGYPTRNACFYEGVTILTPGSKVTLTLGQEPRFGRFFRLTDLVDRQRMNDLNGLTDRQVVDRVDELLQHSVRQMLFADAPVGALCSGGVDSSIIMAMAARQHNNLAIFHANVRGPCSEFDAASLLSRHLGLDLKSVDVHDQDFLDLIPEISDHFEHPFDYHPNSAPFLMVCKLVRQHGVKGVLSGEGADECFLGYPYLAQKPFLDYYARQVDKCRCLIRRIPSVGRFLCPSEQVVPPIAVGMLSRFERDIERQEIMRRYSQVSGTISNNYLTLELLSYHLRTLLHRNDCLGMTASIEARFPFLDERLVNTAVNLPYRHKIRFDPGVFEMAHPFMRDKWVVREVARRYLPPRLSQRKKLGFWVTAFDRMIVAPEYFKKSFVADLFQLANGEMAHLLEQAEPAFRMKLMLLDVWGRLCINAASQDLVRDGVRDHISIRAARTAR